MQEAQQKVMSEYPAPFYWAPFIVIGTNQLEIADLIQTLNADGQISLSIQSLHRGFLALHVSRP